MRKWFIAAGALFVLSGQASLPALSTQQLADLINAAKACGTYQGLAGATVPACQDIGSLLVAETAANRTANATAINQAQTIISSAMTEFSITSQGPAAVSTR